ncbi:MAG: shikimate kinase [Bacilli bacterium]
MDKLAKWRQEINDIDDEIAQLIEKRFNLSKQIGMYKLANQIPIAMPNREQSIKERLKVKLYGEQLVQIYDKVLNLSKAIQNSHFFLIGKKLDYSLSPLIHHLLGNDTYGLMELNNFDSIKKIPFQAINITNPFKTEAFNWCDEWDEKAKITQSVNLLVNKNNRRIGYNTDFGAFLNVLDFYQVDVKNTKVIIIGNGATSRTISWALRERNCQQIIYLVREKRHQDEFLLTDFSRFWDFNVIINTTPYGTNFQDDPSPLFPIEGFRNLKFVFDVVYNPFLTPLLLSAKKRHILCANGLLMLVSQAAWGLEIVKKEKYLHLVNPIYQQLTSFLRNVVLIGMPYSGKTTLGKSLGKGLNRAFYDVDDELKKQGNDLPTLLKSSNLETFRKIEAEVTLNLNKKTSIVLSTGGGIILNAEVMQKLQQTSIIVFVNTSLIDLVNRLDGSRPLAKTKDELEKLFIERISLYHYYADIVVNDDKEAMEKINEYLNNQRS